MNASFENLRADGAFLVSAELKNEKVISLTIKSLKGRDCTVNCDDVKSVVNKIDNTSIPFTKTGDTIIFKTQADVTYALV